MTRAAGTWPTTSRGRGCSRSTAHAINNFGDSRGRTRRVDRSPRCAAVGLDAFTIDRPVPLLRRVATIVRSSGSILARVRRPWAASIWAPVDRRYSDNDPRSAADVPACRKCAPGTLCNSGRICPEENEARARCRRRTIVNGGAFRRSDASGNRGMSASRNDITALTRNPRGDARTKREPSRTHHRGLLAPRSPVRSPVSPAALGVHTFNPPRRREVVVAQSTGSR
jgi:hypothetical protein